MHIMGPADSQVRTNVYIQAFTRLTYGLRLAFSMQLSGMISS